MSAPVNTSQNNSHNDHDLQQQVDVLFVCHVDRVHIISSLLNAVQFKKEQIATVTISPKGMKFTVEEGRSLQANVFLQSELFKKYHFVETTPIQFRISLNILIDCLNIFGSNQQTPVSMEMLYKTIGSPLVMILKEREKESITDVTLRTLESEGISNFNFRGSPILNKIIIQSSSLKEAFNEMDWSSHFIELLLSPDAPNFRLETNESIGSCQVVYPKDSDIFEVFDCSQTQVNRYRASTIQPSIKALGLATKTQLRINQKGTLSLQHMIKTEDDHTCFIDFFVISSQGDEEDEYSQ